MKPRKVLKVTPHLSPRIAAMLMRIAKEDAARDGGDIVNISRTVRMMIEREAERREALKQQQ